jgi:hypothetical protein
MQKVFAVPEELTIFASSCQPASFNRLSPLPGALLRFSVLVQTDIPITVKREKSMKVYLNVRINFIDGERTFTVWPRANRFLPGIEFHSGISDSLADAVYQLKESLPEVFPIDDEYSVHSNSLQFDVVRPFDMVRTPTIRSYKLQIN